jgi:hypothetical protein
MPDPNTPAPGTAPILPSDTPPGTPPATELLAGKYKNVDELVRGYKELESKLGAPKPPVAPATPATPATPPTPKGVVPPVPDAAAAVVAQAGLNFDEFSAEFAQTGTLSEASYEKLTKAGLPKEMVDSYIEGQTTIAEKRQNEVFSTVGGPDAYTKMTEWAAANLTEAEKVAFNGSLTGSLDSVKWAVAGLKAKYDAANGSNPTLVKGGSVSGVGGGYESVAQMTADMKDPKYSKDPAYRDAVRDKIKRTTAF